ncbi:MAG: hypothetical protein M3063_15270 [Actinomycetota bacterium]|nr:hypothetical protein [Actinomycetota bacterium]MDQ6946722.1 hypothetical protein [Actinomycetota bacterium]
MSGYTFDPVDSGGVLLGLRAPQLGALGAGGVLAVVCAVTFSGAMGALLAVGVLVGALAVACWPVHGQPPIAWLPIVAGWLARRRAGPACAADPEQGLTREVTHSAVWPDRPPSPLPRPRRPAPGPGTGPAGVTLLDVPGVPGDAPMGMVRDRRSGTWVAALAVGARSFTLLDPDDQRRRLGAWGAMLAGLARPASPVTRVQWLQTVCPADPDSLPLPIPAMAGAAADYAEVVRAARPMARDHRTLVVVAVRARRGGGDPATVLRREIRLVQGQLANADLLPGSPLDLGALTAAVRFRFAPGAGRGAWPMATDEAWSALRVDGAWHATFWVAEWPRVESGPDFLVPLLMAGGRRTVSVTMGPVPSVRATREVESARTASMADEELRRRAGFLATARRQRQAEGVARREAELADGHAEYRFSGYVTVSGADRPALDVACAEVEHAAQAAHLELRRLWGRQAEAFTWTLPLARGLRP